MAFILIIEDEAQLRENITELLTAYGYDCITAKDGKEGLHIATGNKPDLIICDIALPYLSGFEIKAQLNQFEFTAGIPFIYLSAKNEREDLREGMNLGADDFITKPFKIEELVKSVEARIKNYTRIKNQVNNEVVNTLTDFIKITEHECNSPLNGIINLADLLINGTEMDNTTLVEMAKAIKLSGVRLHKTLNNLIDLIRLQHYQQFNFENLQKTQLDQIIIKTAKRCATDFDRLANLDFWLDKVESSLILKEDLEILLTELFHNAFKFSPKGTNVQLLFKNSPAQKTHYLTISNTSIFPVEFSVNHIRPFYQYNRSHQEQQGSGLGLYLVQLIAKSYHCKLHITAGQNHFSVTLAIPQSPNT
jgi:two-component system sensor histidine kinase/response regulator